jgi:hypothetical protein
MTFIRTLVGGVALVIVLAGIAQAAGYTGVRVKGKTLKTGPGTSDVQIRIVCPPKTQSTPRPGDFSFCTGTMTIKRGGTVLAKGPFSIRTFDSHLEHIPTTAAGRRALKPGKTIAARWVARSHDGRGRQATNAGSVRVRG